MNKLLFISAHVPNPNAQEAGQKTAFRNLVELSKKYEIYLVAACNKLESTWDNENLNQYCSNINLIKINRMGKLLSFIIRPYLPILVATKVSGRISSTLKKLLNEHNFEKVHFEWGQMLHYVNLCSHIPHKTINAVDIMWQLMERKSKEDNIFFKKTFWIFEKIITKFWEKSHYSKVDTIIVHSNKDIKLLTFPSVNLTKKCVIELPFFYKPNISLNELIEIKKTVYAKNEKRIIFWGALSRKENIDGVLFLVKKIFPLLRNKIPNIHLHIVGANPPSSILESNDANIKITGFIDDPTNYLINSHLAVLPLFSGAGVKVKVLECLSFGLPVITTHIGAEGINATTQDGLLVSEADDISFLNVICNILSNDEKALQLSINSIHWSSINSTTVLSQ